MKTCPTEVSVHRKCDVQEFAFVFFLPQLKLNAIVVISTVSKRPMAFDSRNQVTIKPWSCHDYSRMARTPASKNNETSSCRAAAGATQRQMERCCRWATLQTKMVSSQSPNTCRHRRPFHSKYLNHYKTNNNRKVSSFFSRVRFAGEKNTNSFDRLFRLLLHSTDSFATMNNVGLVFNNSTESQGWIDTLLKLQMNAASAKIIKFKHLTTGDFVPILRQAEAAVRFSHFVSHSLIASPIAEAKCKLQ